MAQDCKKAFVLAQGVRRCADRDWDEARFGAVLYDLMSVCVRLIEEKHIASTVFDHAVCFSTPSINKKGALTMLSIVKPWLLPSRRALWMPLKSPTFSINLNDSGTCHERRFFKISCYPRSHCGIWWNWVDWYSNRCQENHYVTSVDCCGQHVDVRKTQPPNAVTNLFT